MYRWRPLTSSFQEYAWLCTGDMIVLAYISCFWRVSTGPRCRYRDRIDWMREMSDGDPCVQLTTTEHGVLRRRAIGSIREDVPSDEKDRRGPSSVRAIVGISCLQDLLDAPPPSPRHGVFRP